MTPTLHATALLAGADYCKKPNMPVTGHRCGFCIAEAIRQAQAEEAAAHKVQHLKDSDKWRLWE